MRANDFQNHLENHWRKRTPVSALMIARTKRQTPNLHQSMQQSTAGRKIQKTIVFVKAQRETKKDKNINFSPKNKNVVFQSTRHQKNLNARR